MQSNRARALIALGAVAAIVVLFVVLSGDGGDDDASTTTRATERTTATGATGAGTRTTTTTTTTERPRRTRPTTIVVRNTEPVGGVKEIEVEKGERVRFAVRSDVPDEVHVHGYDLSKNVSAGGRVSFSFAATIDGVFEVELESGHVQIAKLTVTPS